MFLMHWPRLVPVWPLVAAVAGGCFGSSAPVKSAPAGSVRVAAAAVGSGACLDGRRRRVGARCPPGRVPDRGS